MSKHNWTHTYIRPKDKELLNRLIEISSLPTKPKLIDKLTEVVRYYYESNILKQTDISVEFKAYIERYRDELSPEALRHLYNVQAILETKVNLDEQLDLNKEKEYYEDYLRDRD